MNSLLIGNADKTERLLDIAQQPFLLIDDGDIADAFLSRFPRAKLFDIAKHSFNPVRGIDYRGARDFASIVYTASPQGENTLTVRNGKRSLTRLLLNEPTRLDRLKSSSEADAETLATIDDILLSPVLRRILCAPTNFSFKGSIVAKIDRAELGDFDAFILASLLVGQHKGQTVIPDFGFYGRDFYTSLIRQNRVVAGLNSLSELPDNLQQLVLSIKDKSIYRASPKDAEVLIGYTKHTEPSNIVNLEGNDYLEGR